jgi:hypothetical protein
MMKLVKLGLLGAVATLAAIAPAQGASLIVNGGFENPFGVTLGGGQFYNIGATVADFPIPANFGWSIPTGNIDLIRTDNYGAPFANSGLYRIDLNGYTGGAISQSFNTVAGQIYSLKFDFTSNGSGGRANVLLGALSANINGNPAAVTSFSRNFTGTGGLETLTISSLNGGTGGVVLDNISVSAVPEAATWAMLIAGFGMAGAAMRRRRALAA